MTGTTLDLAGIMQSNGVVSTAVVTGTGDAAFGGSVTASSGTLTVAGVVSSAAMTGTTLDLASDLDAGEA